MDSNKLSFLMAAIADVQATIRAIDVKVGALLVVVLAPFASISRVFAHIDHICKQCPQLLYIILAVTFFTCWFLSVASLIRAIGALDNPAKHIGGCENVNGAFYGGYLFRFNFADALNNRQSVRSTKDLKSFLSEVPATLAEVECEIAFEHMKAVYIRDLKATRLKWGIRFAAAFLFIGTTLYLMSRYGVGKT